MRFTLLNILFLFASLISSQAQTFEWANKISGPSTDYGNGIRTDNMGNVYVIGEFVDTVDFDPGPGIFNLVSNGSYDAFVQKLDSSGNLIWAKSFGGLALDDPSEIRIDFAGNIFISGYFANTCDFDPSLSVYNLTAVGGFDGFILKLDSLGNLLWVKQIGGSQYTYGYSISLSTDNSIYLTGMFSDTCDFDPNASVNNIIASGTYDAFIAKYDYNGNFKWVKTIGAVAECNGNSVVNDALGNVYVGGYVRGTVDLNTGVGTQMYSAGSNEDIFILKLDSLGNFQWAKGIGSTGIDMVGSLVIDSNNDIYATGFFNGTVDFNPGAGISNLTSIASADAFVLKLSSLGNYLWSQSYGGNGWDVAISIDLDVSENIYISGDFSSTAVDWDSGTGVLYAESNGDEDAFILKLDNSGVPIWFAQFGGVDEDWSFAMTVDNFNNVFMTGYFHGVGDFDPGWDVFPLTNYDGFFMDGFTVKLGGQYVGIDEEEIVSSGFVIYPNPATNNLNLVFDENEFYETINIFSSTGQLVFSEMVQTSKSTLDMTSLENGVYFVSVVSKSSIMNKKFVIQH